MNALDPFAETAWSPTPKGPLPPTVPVETSVVVPPERS